MDTSGIMLDIAPPVARLTINRPERRNALSMEMLEAFDSAVRTLGSREDVRVVVISGAGANFSAGADVAPRPNPNPGRKYDLMDDRFHLEERLQRWLAVRELPQVVIAAVEGHCIGIATQLCAMCDITVVAEEARISWPALPLGGGFISPIWAWLVGPSRAKLMSFRPGSAISGREAVDWGWGTLAVPGAELWTQVDGLVAEITRVPLPILTAKKRAIDRQMDLMGFRAGVMMGAEWNALLHASSDVREVRNTIRELGLKGAIASFEGEVPGTS